MRAAMFLKCRCDLYTTLPGFEEDMSVWNNINKQLRLRKKNSNPHPSPLLAGYRLTSAFPSSSRMRLYFKTRKAISDTLTERPED